MNESEKYIEMFFIEYCTNLLHSMNEELNKHDCNCNCFLNMKRKIKFELSHIQNVEQQYLSYIVKESPSHLFPPET